MPGNWTPYCRRSVLEGGHISVAFLAVAVSGGTEAARTLGCRSVAQIKQRHFGGRREERSGLGCAQQQGWQRGVGSWQGCFQCSFMRPALGGSGMRPRSVVFMVSARCMRCRPVVCPALQLRRGAACACAFSQLRDVPTMLSVVATRAATSGHSVAECKGLGPQPRELLHRTVPWSACIATGGSCIVVASVFSQIWAQTNCLAGSNQLFGSTSYASLQPYNPALSITATRFGTVVVTAVCVVRCMLHAGGVPFCCCWWSVWLPCWCGQLVG
jgi:hypothetical protein